MGALDGFLSAWADARATFGAGVPTDGSRFDDSEKLTHLHERVEAAKPTDWHGSGSDSYASANSRHAAVLGELSMLDRRLGAEVTRSAAVVTAGRRDMDGVRKWVLDAAAAVPNNAAAQRALVQIIAKGSSGIAEMVNRSHNDLSSVARRVDALGGEYRALGGAQGRDGGDGDPDGAPPNVPTQPDESGIPGAPPWESHDKGAGEWGSQPWYSRGDDVARKAAIEAGLPLIATQWPHAAELLDHYLDNTGKPFNLNVDTMMNDIPGMQAKADQMVSQQVDRIAADAVANGQYGVPIPFRTGWEGFYMEPDSNPDWYRAVGGVDMSAGGVVTVYPPEPPGGPPIVHVESRIDVADRYNWDQGKETKIEPITVTDQDMGGLQTAGLAREFDMTGKSSVSTYDGTPR